MVDSSAPGRLRHQHLLEAAGYKVRLATSPSDAYTIVLAEADVQLVLLDLKQPPDAGLGLCETLQREHPMLPLIAVTIRQRAVASPLEAFVSGVDAYLVEPTSSVQLLDTIQEWMGTAPSAPVTEAVIRTDAIGRILSLDPAGAQLLGVSVRSAIGRDLLHGFVREPGPLIQALSAALGGRVVQGDVIIGSRDRPTSRLGYTVALEGPRRDAIVWNFSFGRRSPPSARA